MSNEPLFTSPIDATHAAALDARDAIRAWVLLYRVNTIDRWEPRPCPKRWGR